MTRSFTICRLINIFELASKLFSGCLYQFFDGSVFLTTVNFNNYFISNWPLFLHSRYGFITFETEEEAKRVLREGDNLVLKGRKLNVAIAIKKQQVGRIGQQITLFIYSFLISLPCKSCDFSFMLQLLSSNLSPILLRSDYNLILFIIH